MMSTAEKKTSFVRRLYDWTESWSHTHYGTLALFLLAFIESSVFPIPPDVLLIAVVLLHPRKWWYFGAVCTAGSVLGGLFGYWIGFAVWEMVQGFFFQYVFSHEKFEKVQEIYRQYDFWAVFTAAFTPIPYKVFTIAAGVFDLDLARFTLASAVGRGGRFFLVAGILRAFGPAIKPFVEKYVDIISIVFLVLLVGAFLLLKFVL